MHQPPSAATHLVRFGVFELDLRSGELRKGGIRVPLQDQPFRVLVRLVEHPGEVVTREQLREQLWPAETFVDFDHGLNAAVRRLRDALGESADTPRFIETVPRRGYRFIAPLETSVVPQPEPHPVPERTRRRPRIVFALGVAGALIALATIVMVWTGRPPLLSERDHVLLADFVNHTGDAVFDVTLSRALAVKLEESPFLSIVADESVRQTLRLMDQPADERVTPALGREVCVRLGVQAMISGEIARLGDRYAISLTAVNCGSGDVLARAHDEAGSKAAVLDALGRAGGALRANLGERLSSIQQLDKPLPEATTASLEALRAFSLGEQQRARGRTRDAMPFYTRAIELDPDFALAYARLSLLHANLDQFTRAAHYAAQAFERVDRVSERERFYILEAYHRFVSLDVEEHRNTIQLWVQTYPRDARAVQRLALYHIARGECEAGLEYAREQMRLQPEAFAYGTITLAHQCLGQFEEARAIAERAVEEQVDLPYLRILLYRVAFALGDAATMERQVDWAAGQPTEHLMRREQALVAATRGQLGRARGLLQEAVEIAQANDVVEHAALVTASGAFIEAVTDHRDQARKRAAMAIRISRNEVALFWAGLALGLARAPDARKLVDELPPGQYPTLPVPWVQAAAELGKRPDRTLEVLRRSARYEPVDGTTISQYLRGEAYLESGAPTDAAREFRKLVDRAFGASGHPHTRDDWRPLLRVVAHARLGRAHAEAGEFDEAREAYRRFFDLWKDADPEVALLKAAQAEYATLPPPPTGR